MKDPALLAACLIAAFIVLSGLLGIVGIACCIAQCINHGKQIWKFHKNREG